MFNVEEFLLLLKLVAISSKPLLFTRYVAAFGQLAKTSTTVMLPANPGDVGGMVAQAMGIYGKVRERQIGSR